MALGALTLVAPAASHPGPVYFDSVSFAGDSSYTTGGTTGFDALVSALVGRTATVLGIICLDAGGYVPAYLSANGGTLKVYEAAADGNPLDEAASMANLASTTFRLIVISQ